MRVPLYQVDAFTSRAFGGNPAAVCPLLRPLPDALMQSIAAENNLSETAFLHGGDGRYAIRWFTPTTEVPLCGHATLASAWVVFHRLEPARERVMFDSASGPLVVTREGGRLVLDFPSIPSLRVDLAPAMDAAFGLRPLEAWEGSSLMLLFADEGAIRALRPSAEGIARLHAHGVIATAPGESSDIVSRFFAPNLGVFEDPVTGSAHAQLTPWWSRRLARTTLSARQLSQRGGELTCELAGPRVRMAGDAVLYLEGEIELPGA